MKLKICGLNNPQNILEIASLKPDYMGFIFYKGSKRYIDDNLNEEILNKIPETTKRVGVFVNENMDNVLEMYYKYKLDYVQLHGTESQLYCAKLFLRNIPVIKAFSVGQYFDFKQLNVYQPFCKYFLFDTKGVTKGGTGKKFDWDILKLYDLRFPFFLSGGIGPEDIDAIAKLSKPQLYAIDINSKFEIEPGIKNVEDARNFYTKLKQINQHISC